MRVFKLSFQILSPLMTPLMADTLWGIICWGIRYFDGEKALKGFLSAYETSSPPLILSDPFPSGYLPVPKLKPVTKEKMSKEEYGKIKKIKKIEFIKAKYFFDKVPINYSILEESIENQKNLKTQARLHNVVDRLTNTVKENSLYEKVELWYRKKSIFDVYILSSISKDEIVRIFLNAFLIGYGADTSLGKGHLQFVSIDEGVIFPSFPENEIVRGMALASFIPSPRDKFDQILYSLKTKYGKLGGEFAIKGNPFKKPLLMYQSGATFSSSGRVSFVGTLVSNVHSSYSFVKHYALAPVIYFKEGEENVI